MVAVIFRLYLSFKEEICIKRKENVKILKLKYIDFSLLNNIERSRIRLAAN